MYFIQRCFICRPSDSTVSEDAGIDEPRTVATSALAVGRPNHSDLIHKVFVFSLVYLVFFKKFLTE